MWWLSLHNSFPMPRVEPFTALAILAIFGIIIWHIVQYIAMAIYYIVVFLATIWYITIPIAVIAYFIFF